MKKIFLLRHAKSDWQDKTLDDFDRTINDRGRETAGSMGAYLSKEGIRPDFILCSPAIRARQTFKLLGPALGGIPTDFEEQLYLLDFRGILERIKQVGDEISSLMVIGHNPATEEIMGFLTGEYPDKYPTCTLAGLNVPGESWKDLDAGKSSLDLFIRPKDLG